MPVFDSEEGEFCPCFYLQRAEDETDEEFVAEVEQSASKILGEVSEREYLSHRAISGMPRLNRVFEEMKVRYGDRKVPEKILKSVEDKSAKVSRSAAALAATVRAESRKRRDGDAPKAIAKKRKVAKVATDSVEKVAESGHGGPEAARHAGAAVQASASASCPDKDLMGSSVGAAAVAGARAMVVDPLPCMLGYDSSESKGDAAEAGSATASGSEEASTRAGRSAKTQHLEESEAESGERPVPTVPGGQEAVSTSPRAVGAGTSSEVAGAMLLGKLFYVGLFCLVLAFIYLRTCFFL